MLLMKTLVYKLLGTSTATDVSEVCSIPFQIDEYTNTWPSNTERERD